MDGPRQAWDCWLAWRERISQIMSGQILLKALARAILRPVSALKLSDDSHDDSPVTIKPLFRVKTQKVCSASRGWR